MRVKDELHNILQRIGAWYRGLTPRERYVLIPLAAAFVVSYISYSVYIPLRDAFDAQATELEKVEQDLKTLPFVLNRYQRLVARKSQIEEEYKEVEIAEGERTFLEKVVQEKVGNASGFEINLRPVSSFGGNYQQAPFSVKFYTSNLQSVVDFLTEVVLGKKRLLLTKIDINKSRAGDRLEVDVDVSSIRKIK